MLAQKLIIAMYYMVQFFQYAILVQVVLSWFARSGGRAYAVFLVLTSFLEPIYRPFRRIGTMLALRTGLDFTPFMAMISLSLFYKLFAFLVRLVFLV